MVFKYNGFNHRFFNNKTKTFGVSPQKSPPVGAKHEHTFSKGCEVSLVHSPRSGTFFD